MTNSRVILKRALAYVLVFALAFTTAFTSTGFQSNAAAKKVTSIKVAKTKVSVQVGKTSSVKVTVKGTKGATKFTAKSSKKAVATVKVSGKKVKITGKKKGKATITVTTKYKNKKGKKLKKKIKVTVKAAPVTPTAAPTTAPTTAPTKAPTAAPVNPTPTTAPVKPEDKYSNVSITTPSGDSNITPGSSMKLTIAVDEADKSLVKWEAEDPAVATVDASGTVTAGKAGTTVIKATINGKVIGTVTVSVPATAVTGVEIKDAENGVKLTVSGATTLTPIITPANATNTKVTWHSDNAEIASVDADGKVVGKKAGTTKITVTTVDGGKIATVDVTVTDESKPVDDGLTLDVTSTILEDYSDATKSIYSILTGTDVNVRVRLVDDGKGLAKRNVKLTMKPQYSWGLEGKDYLYKIEGNTLTKTSQTDDDGYINFAVSLTEDFIDAKPIDGCVQSFEITASSTDSKTTASATLRFGSIDIQKALILNESWSPEDYVDDTEGINRLVPGLNADRAGQAAVEDISDIDGYHTQYVASQQVSVSGTDHTVYAFAAPYIMLPPSLAEIKSGDYLQEFDSSKYTSGSYSVYNDETNTTTTKEIERIPAGLKYATLKFNKIELSDYTCLMVNFYELEDGIKKIIPDATVRLYPDAVKSEALEIQVPQSVFDSTHDICAVISLQSEGQVNTDKNGGYILSSIVGEWKSQQLTKPTNEYLDGYTTWESDDQFGRSSTNGKGKSYNLARTDALKYLPTGEDVDYRAEDVTYSYTVPSFPHVGNAIITAKGAEQEWKFTYPITTSDNINDIASPLAWRKAALISDDEAQNKVGTINASGNLVTVNTTKTGYTALKATIDISALAGMEDVDKASRVFSAYSYIQWAPFAYEEQDAEATDFYALKGQSVTIVGQLMDLAGNPVSQSGLDVEFLQDGKTILFDQLKDFIVDPEFQPKSKNGKITFDVINSNTSDILNRLSAKSDAYVVKFTIGGITTDVATIHWVKPGLYYKNAVDIYEEGKAPVITKTVECFGGTETVEDLSHSAGTNWEFGLKTIGKLPTSDELDGYTVDNIDGISVNYTQQGTGTFNANGNSFDITNTSGSDIITGYIDEDSVVNDSDVFFTIMKDGELVGVFQNVGKGKVTGLDAKISIPIVWTVSGMVVDVASSTGKTTFNRNIFNEIYVTVTDNFGTPLENKEVVYSVTELGDLAAIDNQKIYTNSNGVAIIYLDAPNQEGRVNISVKVGTVKKPYSIAYTATDAAAFEISSVDADVKAGTLTVTFNKPILKDTVLREQFEISDTLDATKKFRIDTVEASADDKVLITLENKEILKNYNDLSQLLLKIKDYPDPATSKTYVLYDMDRLPLSVYSMNVSN